MLAGLINFFDIHVEVVMMDCHTIRIIIIGTMIDISYKLSAL